MSEPPPPRDVVDHAVEELIEAIRIALEQLAAALESPDPGARADARIALERMLDAASTRAREQHGSSGSAPDHLHGPRFASIVR